MLLIHDHEPGWAGTDVTVILRWKPALSCTGTSKVTTTGMATPTVVPSAASVGRICCFLDRVVDVKARWTVVGCPSVFVPVMDRVYAVPGSSRDWAVHCEPSGASSPATVAGPALGSW